PGPLVANPEVSLDLAPATRCKGMATSFSKIFRNIVLCREIFPLGRCGAEALNAPNQITSEKREPVPFAPPWPTPDERCATGKARRGSIPRSSHSKWNPPPNRADPIELLVKSNQTRLTHLVPIRHGRMLDSPFSFLRGAAIVMANDLAATPITGFRAQLCG